MRVAPDSALCASDISKDPMKAFDLHGLGVWQLAKQVVAEFGEDAMPTYAAALAYRAIFSIFPFLLFLVALLGVLDLPQLFEWLQQQAALVVPGETMDQVTQVLQEVKTPKGGLLSLGILLAIWSAAGGVLSAMEALNVAYDVRETRPAWKRYLLAILYTVGIAALMILAAAFMVLGPQLAGPIADFLGLQDVFVTVWAWLRWPVAVLLLLLVIALVYYVGPDIEQPFRYITPGAMLAVVVWILASAGFGWYVANFADYSATYGSIGAIIVMLFYFYISASVLLFGAEVNAVIEQHSQEAKAEVKKDPEHPQKLEPAWHRSAPGR
jgi:membrane protein